MSETGLYDYLKSLHISLALSLALSLSLSLSLSLCLSRSLACSLSVSLSLCRCLSLSRSPTHMHIYFFLCIFHTLSPLFLSLALSRLSLTHYLSHPLFLCQANRYHSSRQNPGQCRTWCCVIVVKMKNSTPALCRALSTREQKRSLFYIHRFIGIEVARWTKLTRRLGKFKSSPIFRAGQSCVPMTLSRKPFPNWDFQLHCLLTATELVAFGNTHALLNAAPSVRDLTPAKFH